MDSRLLSGAYSKRYRYIERDQLENITSDGELQGSDALAKSRRLSQETNKRRKLLAQKRKQEAAREEKRRQDILNKRHQEQKQATEKYQRCHVGSRPRLSPSSRRRIPSPSRNPVALEDALRLIVGSSSSNVPTDQSREAIQRLQHNQQNGRDPLERSQVRSSRASSAGHRETRQSHNRPMSGRPLDASMRAQLMERSLRNLTSSRSRFEQQLEQHQQLLAEQQQKSLHDFNQAIRQEIEADFKVQGVEENEQVEVPLQSESLSSLDSLDEGNQSLNSSGQDHSGQRNFHPGSDQPKESSQTYNSNTDMGGPMTMTYSNSDTSGSVMMQQQRSTILAEGRMARPLSGKVPTNRLHDSQKHTANQSQNGTVNVTSQAHLIGPIPQGYYAPQSGLPPSNAPVIQGNLSHYADHVDPTQTSPQRQVTVGTALRLPQEPPPSSQPVKQPPPTLQYDSQLLAHRRFDVHPNQNRNAVHSANIVKFDIHSNQNTNAAESGFHTNANQQEVHGSYAATNVHKEPTSALTQNEQPEERPKAHVYAWSSPPPEEENEQNTASSDGHSIQNNGGSYSASVVADRVMATNLHPQTCRTISTAATSTCIYQTVNPAPNKKPAYAQAGVTNTASLHQTGFPTNTSHAEITRGPEQKQASGVSYTGAYPSTTGLRFETPASSPYRDYVMALQNSQQSNLVPSYSHSASHNQSELQRREGVGQGQTTQGGQKIMVVEEETDGRKEVRSILKKVNKDMLKAVGQTKFNVQDSLEIAKMHMRNHEHVKRKKVQKKGVRFADLHYPEEVQEDTDSGDSMMDANAEATNTDDNASTTKTQSAPDGKTAGKRGTVLKPHSVSARMMSSSSRGTDGRSRVPRVASAGSSRNSQAVRPKAAAHIIMSGEGITPSSQQTAGESSITAHKSELEKKVMLINNNFMSRVPMYSGSEAPTTSAAVYTAVSEGKDGKTIAANSTIHNDASAQSKTTYSQPSDQPRVSQGKAVAPAPHTTMLPSHSHFSNYKAVYNENGMRIDRTPTDDEINNLWKNMRTMLDVNDGKATGSVNPNPNDQTSRQQVQLSHQYIDGASLGKPSSMRRTPGYPANKPSTVNGTAYKAEGQNKNGYLQRYSLLQQRKAPRSGLGGGSGRPGDVVEQTVQPMPISTNAPDSRHPAVSVSYGPREEMTESMAGFLAAEQAIQSQGVDIRDSRVMAAMESAQNQQEMYNSIRHKFAKGGPSALSLEEQHLLESLDKLNDRLKVVENRQPISQQTVNYSNIPSSHQVFVHRPGFRGHQVISSHTTRHNSGGQRTVTRPMSPRLFSRPYR